MNDKNLETRLSLLTDKMDRLTDLFETWLRAQGMETPSRAEAPTPAPQPHPESKKEPVKFNRKSIRSLYDADVASPFSGERCPPIPPVSHGAAPAHHLAVGASAPATASPESLHDSDVASPFSGNCPIPVPPVSHGAAASAPTVSLSEIPSAAPAPATPKNDVQERAKELMKHEIMKHDTKSDRHTKVERVTDLRQAISVNDRFLLLRDVFHNDPRELSDTIDCLNTFTTLDDCLIYISEHYNWNPHSDGVRALMEILGRKLQ